MRRFSGMAPLETMRFVSAPCYVERQMRWRPTVSFFAAFFLVAHFGSQLTSRVAAQTTNTPDQSSAPAEVSNPQPEKRKLSVLVLLLGGGARFRKIRLDVGDGSGGNESRSLDTGPFFDFAWHLMARPWARVSPKPAMQAMIVQIDGGAGVGLTVEPAETGISLRANTWRLLGQLGYLYPLERIQVGGLVGVGADVLQIDLNSVLPSSRILYVRLGPALARALVSDFLGLRFDFGLRFPFALGDLADSFGSDSSALGVDAALMIGGRLEAGFSYAFQFVWEYYRLRFDGETLDVPSMGEGGWGTDHGLTFQLLLGWSL